MTPSLLAFCDAKGDLRYINLNNVEVIRFDNVPNIMTERLVVRYKSGTVLNYELLTQSTEVLKKKLNTFTVG